MEPALASWLVAERLAIDREAARAGAAIDPASPEAEALRRFRSFALAALAHGHAEPALEGLRVSLRRAAAVIDAWLAATGRVAGPDAPGVRALLAPLRAHFVAALAASAPGRRAGGTPIASARRAVPSAIDRLADVFLAVDCDSGAVVDANPAACALLGLARPELLARTLLALAPTEAHAAWQQLLDAQAEGAEPTRVRLALCDASGAEAALEVRATRWGTRGQTLALCLCRPAP